MTAVSASHAAADTLGDDAPAEASRAAQDRAGVVERFVVGVDGSARSIEALCWAARIAAGTGAHIDVLTTWKPQLRMPGPLIATASNTNAGPESDAQALLARVLHAAYGTDDPPNVSVRAHEGDAAQFLLAQSETAQLLVIGSRGLGEVAGLLLGSVSARCAEQAHCPVLIIHEPRQC
jgi:nucleotide-binding universal stress UspA family protein